MNKRTVSRHRSAPASRIHFAEGIAATNDSPCGLQAGVFTTNVEHAFMAFREIEAGAVIVGDTGVFRVDTIRSAV
jgi:glyceraldehyde-3-phosphate dehydrogenase (NADP+)